mgnify:CR=1 FL=1
MIQALPRQDEKTSDDCNIERQQNKTNTLTSPCKLLQGIDRTKDKLSEVKPLNLRERDRERERERERKEKSVRTKRVKGEKNIKKFLCQEIFWPL